MHWQFSLPHVQVEFSKYIHVASSAMLHNYSCQYGCVMPIDPSTKYQGKIVTFSLHIACISGVAGFGGHSPQIHNVVGRNGFFCLLRSNDLE